MLKRTHDKLEPITNLTLNEKVWKTAGQQSAFEASCQKSCAAMYAMLGKTVVGEVFGQQTWDREGRTMFRVEEVEGKGKGCLANRRIEVGELILREKPALLLKPRNDEEVDSVEEDEVEEEVETLEAFLGMTREQQVEFLELANMYDDNARRREEWPGEKDFEAINLSFNLTF